MKCYQMKRPKYSVVFPLRNISKNLILLVFTKYYQVLLCSTYENLKLHEVAYLLLH